MKTIAHLSVRLVGKQKPDFTSKLTRCRGPDFADPCIKPCSILSYVNDFWLKLVLKFEHLTVKVHVVARGSTSTLHRLHQTMFISC